MRVGVDTGGTFTDCVAFAGPEIKILKIFSTPHDPSQGILEGVRRLADDAERPVPLEIIHGTTVGTNSLLERRGARVALVTTAGFEDLIEIGRQNRPQLYNFDVRRHPPLVRREMRWGVKERIAADGGVLARPQPGGIARLIRQIKSSGAESIALCFLFSFRNPENERRVARGLRKIGLPISVSHEILPEFREYERLSTIVINAYLAPRLGSYIANLEHEVIEAFPSLGEDKQSALGNRPPRRRAHRHRDCARIYVMQSSGGITTASRAAREPVRTILSGPAGGVVAAARLAKLIHAKRAISFDMGGTSTDVCLIDGDPRTTRETTLAGLPVAVPVLDVHSVGAGGGSMARVDAGGALRVGPESAGAFPGPICYGRGGVRPTVTDAHLVLGRLDPDHFLAGSFRLVGGEVEKRFEEFVQGVPRNLDAFAPRSTIDLARGIIAVSNATMERALRLISVERGHDPRDFTLICFGGAGGLHAADLARGMGLAGVIVPQHPGAFSALGIVLSDTVRDVSKSVLIKVDSTEQSASGARAARRQFRDLFQRLEKQFSLIEKSALIELRREHLTGGRMRRERRLALRYVGQAYELSIPFSLGFISHFHHEHEKTYGYAQPERAIEIVSLQVRITMPSPQPSRGRREPAAVKDHLQAIVKIKPVWFGGKLRRTPLYARERLGTGVQFMGPAIVTEYSSTTVVPPDFSCHVDEHFNLKLRQNES